MTSSAFGSPIDQEAIQILRRVLQKMKPEEIVQVGQKGVPAWEKMTINTLSDVLKHEAFSKDALNAVWEQLKSPDELLKFIEAPHPDFVLDLKPGLKESIERLILEARGELQASFVGYRDRVSKTIVGTNRIKALLKPTEEEMAVLREANKKAEASARAAASAETIPQFLDRSVLQGAAFAESIIPEAEKEVILHAVFPEFKISRDMLRYRPQEWLALLIEEGEFSVIRSEATEAGTFYVLKSAHAGGIEMSVSSLSLAGVRLTTVDLCYSFQEKGIEVLVPWRHHWVYHNDALQTQTLFRDGKEICKTFFP